MAIVAHASGLDHRVLFWCTKGPFSHVDDMQHALLMQHFIDYHAFLQMFIKIKNRITETPKNINLTFTFTFTVHSFNLSGYIGIKGLVNVHASSVLSPLFHFLIWQCIH